MYQKRFVSNLMPQVQMLVLGLEKGGGGGVWHVGGLMFGKKTQITSN